MRFSCVIHQLWYLIVSIPDLCILPYFHVYSNLKGTSVSKQTSRFDLIWFCIVCRCPSKGKKCLDGLKGFSANNTASMICNGSMGRLAKTKPNGIKSHMHTRVNY